MLERDIEKHLVKRCKQEGIHRDKFSSPQKSNVPDDILTYRGVVIFLELKAPGKKPSAAQVRDHVKRRDHGAIVCWTDSKDGVDALVQAFKTGQLEVNKEFKVAT